MDETTQDARKLKHTYYYKCPFCNKEITSSWLGAFECCDKKMLLVKTENKDMGIEG